MIRIAANIHIINGYAKKKGENSNFILRFELFLVNLQTETQNQ